MTNLGVLTGAVLTSKNRRLKPGAVDWCQPWKKRLMNLFSQFHENADKIPNSKAMGYLPKKWKKKTDVLYIDIKFQHIEEA